MSFCVQIISVWHLRLHNAHSHGSLRQDELFLFIFSSFHLTLIPHYSLFMFHFHIDNPWSMYNTHYTARSTKCGYNFILFSMFRCGIWMEFSKTLSNLQICGLRLRWLKILRVSRFTIRNLYPSCTLHTISNFNEMRRKLSHCTLHCPLLFYIFHRSGKLNNFFMLCWRKKTHTHTKS